MATVQVESLTRPRKPAAERSPEPWEEPAPTGGRRRRLPRKAVVGVLVAALLAVGGYQAVRRLRPSRADAGIQTFDVTRRSFPVILKEEGELKAASQIDIRCELEGRATIINLVEEGKSVKAGDLLIEMASDEIDEKTREAESKEVLARAAYEASEKELQILIDKNATDLRKAQVKHELALEAINKYTQGDAVQSRQEKELALDEARYNLKRSKAALSDSEDLFKEGFVTRLDVENDQAAVYQNEIKLKNAELALEVLNKYTIPMDLRQKQSEMEEARDELERKKKEAHASEEKLRAETGAKKSDHKLAADKLARLVDQKKKTRIIAPADGLVVYFKQEWWDESRIIKAGAQVHEQQILVQLPDTSSMKVAVRVHEAKAEKLKVGLPAMVQIEGLNGRLFAARVSKVAVLASSKDSWLNPNLKEYETEVLLDGTHKDLKPGVTAHVEIKTADMNNVLAVPVQTVFGKGRRHFVFVRDGSQTKPVEVKLGMNSTEFVEVTEGLKGGERVCLAVSDAAKTLLPDDTEEADRAGSVWASSQPASAPAGQPTTAPVSASSTSEPAMTQPATAPASQPATKPADIAASAPAGGPAFRPE